MKPIETYVERGVGIDPYVSFAETATKVRLQGGRRNFSAYNLRILSTAEARVRPTLRSPRGSLSLISLIPKSRTGRPEGLTDLLQTLEAVRIKADPYAEIGEQLQAVIAKILKPIAEKPAEPVQKSLDDFLRPVRQLVKGGQIDAALDVLYDRVNDLLLAKGFSTMDALLQQVNVNSLSVDILLGLLTASLPARSKLPSRSKFYAAVAASIRERGEWEDGLLTGLES